MSSVSLEILQQLCLLRRAPGPVWTADTMMKAPYKPLLLLSVCDLFEQNAINANRIELDENLKRVFHQYWDIFDYSHAENILLPFYHLDSEPFWTLKSNDGNSKMVFSPTWDSLNSSKSHAKLHSALYDLLKYEDGRRIVRGLLLSEYFSPDASIRIEEQSNLNLQSFKYSQELDEFLSLPFTMNHASEREFIEQNRQVRDHGFRTKICREYSYTCAVCQTRVQTSSGRIMVEGAHIIPYSLSNNNDPRNGIALCRNHHWMFDNYMLTVRPDYTVQLSSWLSERPNVADETLRLNDKRINLPGNELLYPAELALNDHNERFAVAQQDQ